MKPSKIAYHSFSSDDKDYLMNYLSNQVNYSFLSKVRNMFKIKRVIFNKPATVVFWNDGTKTVVKTQKDEAYDPEKGLTMAVTKKLFGNTGRYYNEVKKWLPKDEDIDVDESIKSSFNHLGEKFKKELEKEM